jgi:hypothetical protein
MNIGLSLLFGLVTGLSVLASASPLLEETYNTTLGSCTSRVFPLLPNPTTSQIFAAPLATTPHSTMSTTRLRRYGLAKPNKPSAPLRALSSTLTCTGFSTTSAPRTTMTMFVTTGARASRPGNVSTILEGRLRKKVRNNARGSDLSSETLDGGNIDLGKEGADNIQVKFASAISKANGRMTKFGACSLELWLVRSKR